MLTYSLPVRHVAEFADAVRDGLTKAGQKELPSKYLYDEVGSALFETICVLPEYGLTRADARLLETHAREIVERLPRPISGGGVGQRHGEEDALDPGSAVATAADVLLPDRDFAFGARGLRKRAWTDRSGERGWLRADLSGRAARGGEEPRFAGASAGFVSGQHDWKFRSRDGRRVFARSARHFAARATRCCWAPIWRRMSRRKFLRMTIRPE